MMKFIIITVTSLLFVLVNAYFNAAFIKQNDFHSIQSLQFVVMFGYIVFVGLISFKSLESLIVAATTPYIYRAIFFDSILNAFRGLSWDYNLFINPFAKMFLLVLIILLNWWYVILEKNGRIRINIK